MADSNTTTASTTSSTHASYYCHGCKAEIQPPADNLVCPTCGSEFIEEVEPSDPPTQFVAFNNNNDNINPTNPQIPPQPQLTQQQGPQRRQANFVFATQPIPFNIHNIFTQIFNNPQAPPVHVQQGQMPPPLFQANFPPMPLPFADMVAMIQGGNMNDIFSVFGMPMAGNPNDYANGNMEQLLNQLFQNAHYRGTPPASKSAIDHLKRGKIEYVENLGECAICKDVFEVGVDYVEMPCTHIFHPDCLHPWLDIHNSCPVCRLELKTDDPDYEARKNRSQPTNNSPSS